MMNIFAVDVANSYCSVAIISNGAVMGSSVIKERNKQAELLLCITEDLLSENNMSYNDFDAFVVTVGPGSFIGIRIGIAALQGMKLITNKPLYGVSTLEVIAFMLSKNNPHQYNIQAVLDAGRNYAYYQCFSEHLIPLTDPCITKVDNLTTDEFLVGDNLNTSTGLKIIPDAKNAGLLAVDKINAGNAREMKVKPLYIR